jgi:hypothetical protein
MWMLRGHPEIGGLATAGPMRIGSSERQALLHGKSQSLDFGKLGKRASQSFDFTDDL